MIYSVLNPNGWFCQNFNCFKTVVVHIRRKMEIVNWITTDAILKDDLFVLNSATACKVLIGLLPVK